ncbi:hypothetical protein PDG61_04465 [Mycolicibacterium sp. BiH015]|nr:hypothetical protein [Mycolicibacterium sp. BiH015]MDA2890154.1 hypothetical protein [Mycolicibacterium sp. BiH015]
MEDSPTPWLIAQAIESAGIKELWFWAAALLGAALVLIGGMLFCA